jgi:RNA polymerase sigma-70 factor (ECF subfamily)
VFACKLETRPERARANVAKTAAEQIAAVAASGDQHAYAALFRYFAPRVKSYLRLTGLPDEAAEELSQETMFRVWRSAHDFDLKRGAPAAWVYQIARNLRRDNLRHERRARDPHLCEIELYTGDAESICITHQEQIYVTDVLRSLQPRLSEVVRLAYFEHLSHSQIGKRLDLPLGTVKTRLRLAMEKLRRHLAAPI